MEEGCGTMNLSISERVEKLLDEMTLAEKCGQLNQRLYGWETYEWGEDSQLVLTDTFKQEVEKFGGIGALYGLFRADPWSKMDESNGILRQESAKAANQLQKYVIQNTRLGIPMLLAEEVPHGHQALESESYPVNLAKGASFNVPLQKRTAEAVSEEISTKGVHLALASALDILRDPRWGRSEECFGEDPFLASEMTEALVSGMQESGKVAVVLKHFAAQGEPVGGHNSGPVSIGERELREIFLPPMFAGKHAKGVMAAYNEIDGIPCHANRKLLTEILRGEIGFSGIVMADGCALDRLLMLNENPEEAAKIAISAGVDLSLWDEIYPHLEAAVTNGLLLEKQIDQAVRRVLTLKFELGLFDNPYIQEELPATDSKSLNLESARESICLLENRNQTLPFSKKVKKIAVIGPNADALYNQLGDYTAPQKKGSGITVLEGMRQVAPPNTEIVFEKGSRVRERQPQSLERAREIALGSEQIVLVLGSSSARNFDMAFLKNGAVSSKGPNMDTGENVDVANLELPDCQLELYHTLRELNIPLTVVVISGRPNALSEIAHTADALVMAFYPGALGGLAVAETLFGKNNPSGKLPASLPYETGQLPVYYNQKNVVYQENYFDAKGAPLYPFGYGKSYSEFIYHKIWFEKRGLSVDELNRGATFHVAVELENVSDLAGKEVVQLYIRGRGGSITRRKRELKAFRKMEFLPKEIKKVCFKIGKKELEVWSAENKYELEPGKVDLIIGNGRDTYLETWIEIEEE